MNSVTAFRKRVLDQLTQLEQKLKSIPASTITFVAKPDRTIDPALINLLPEMAGTTFSLTSVAFRNCISFIFHLDKAVMCKIFKNGTLQITGCKTKQHPIVICNRIQQFLGCIYTIVSAMENVYTELGLNVDKLKLYNLWKWEAGGTASPPIGAYTAVRLRIQVDKCAQTKYFIGRERTFVVTSMIPEPVLVNIAIFHNGKILFSGVNRPTILEAAKMLVSFAKEHDDIFIQKIGMFC